MKRKFFLLTGVAVAAAVLLLLTLGGAGRTPNVSADPYDYSWDVVLCDGAGGQNDALCAESGARAQDNGGTLGVIEVGDNPEMQSHLAIDPEPYSNDVGFFGLATTTWKGIAPAGPGDITEGDIVGDNIFSIKSNSTITGQGTSGVDATTGQPLVCGVAGTIDLAESFPLYAADMDAGDGVDNDGDTLTDEEILNTLDDDGDQHEDGTRGNPGDDECTDGVDNGDGDGLIDADDPQCSGSGPGIDEDTRSVSPADEDGDGTQEEFEDNVGENCIPDNHAWGTAPNGIYDGVDCLTDPVLDYYIPLMQSQGLGDPIGRAFGMAPILGGVVKVPVNFVLYNYDTDGDTIDDGYLSFTLVLYPGAIPSARVTSANVTSQTTITCTPFASNTIMFGITQGNNTAAFGLPASPAPSITGGVANRTVVGEGDFNYVIALSLSDNYDGDAAADSWESCQDVTSIDTDLNVVLMNPQGTPTAHMDPDFDRWDSGCDPFPASPDNDNDGNSLNPNLPPADTFDLDPDNCNHVYDPVLAGGWDCDQDVDGDTYLNTTDNCPFDADEDIDNADGDNDVDTGVDWQMDSDGDTVGDVCDLSPNQYGTKGDGTGYAIDAHPHGAPSYEVNASGTPVPAGTPLPGYHDHDDACDDAFAIPSSEKSAAVGDGGVCPALDEGKGYVDSSNEGDPDWYDADGNGAYTIGLDPIDTDTDSDADGHSDACEAVNGSDPLDASSVPAGPPAAGDCDGDTVTDVQEEKDQRDPFVSGPGETPTPTATPTPTITPTPTNTPVAGACVDRDGDSSCRDESVDADDDGCTATQEAGLGTDDDTWYDIFDVPAPANPDPTVNGARSREVSIGDVLSVLFYTFADTGGPPNPNGVSYDSTKGMVSPHIDPPQNLVVGMMYDRSSGDPDPDGPGPFIDPAGPPNGVIDMGDVLIVLAQANVVDCTG